MWVMIVAAIIALSCNIAIEVVTKFNISSSYISSCYMSYSVTCAQQENDALAIGNIPATANHIPAAAENIPATVNHTPAAAKNIPATVNRIPGRETAM